MFRSQNMTVSSPREEGGARAFVVEVAKNGQSVVRGHKLMWEI